MVSIFIFETVISLDLPFFLFAFYFFPFEAQKITVHLIIAGCLLGEIRWVGNRAYGLGFPEVKGPRVAS